MSSNEPRRTDSDAVVLEELVQFLRENGKEQLALTDGDRLDGELGLSSFDVTSLLVRLAARLDISGSERLMASTDMATVGDLCRAFGVALGEETETGPDELMASLRRAASRRAAG